MKQWYDEHIRLKEDKAVVKLFNEDGSFKKSIIIPTDYYPLNGRYETFTAENTVQCRDEAVLDIFDSVTYRIGRCYTNTKELVEKLRAAGYDAKSYAGWLFTEARSFPIHHCWAVVNGNMVLDLCDDYTVMLSGQNGKNFEAVLGNVEAIRLLIASFQKAGREWPNRARCCPVGKPTDFFLYIGCECEPDDARRIYQKLIARYPGHECERNCNAEGLNATQRVMREAGLM